MVLTRANWEAQRPTLRAALWRLLGEMPPLFTPQATLLNRSLREGCTLEHLVFDNEAGAQVYGYLLLPSNLSDPVPAVLYHHLHGNKYALGKDEVFSDQLAGAAPGLSLVKAGFAVFAIDAYCFGERQMWDVAGVQTVGAETEQALFKHFLWRGATLWGMMVHDDLLALNYLLSRPEIEAERIGATGMSLGGTRTSWLGALDDRLKVIVPIAQMTRYQNFAASGRYNLHGIYYYVPGMLTSGIDMEHIAALTAPRHQAILVGDIDPLSPIEGVQDVIAFTRDIYRLYDAEAHFQPQVYAGVAHRYTPEMLAAMVGYFREHL